MTQKHATRRTRITRKKLREWGACWGDKKIARFVPPGGVTVGQLLRSRSAVRWRDRGWVLARVLSDEQTNHAARIEEEEGHYLHHPDNCTFCTGSRARVIERVLTEVLR